MAYLKTEEVKKRGEVGRDLYVNEKADIIGKKTEEIKALNTKYADARMRNPFTQDVTTVAMREIQIKDEKEPKEIKLSQMIGEKYDLSVFKDLKESAPAKTAKPTSKTTPVKKQAQAPKPTKTKAKPAATPKPAPEAPAKPAAQAPTKPAEQTPVQKPAPKPAPEAPAKPAAQAPAPTAPQQTTAPTKPAEPVTQTPTQKPAPAPKPTQTETPKPAPETPAKPATDAPEATAPQQKITPATTIRTKAPTKKEKQNLETTIESTEKSTTTDNRLGLEDAWKEAQIMDRIYEANKRIDERKNDPNTQTPSTTSAPSPTHYHNNRPQRTPEEEQRIINGRLHALSMKLGAVNAGKDVIVARDRYDEFGIEIVTTQGDIDRMTQLPKEKNK